MNQILKTNSLPYSCFKQIFPVTDFEGSKYLQNLKVLIQVFRIEQFKIISTKT